MTSLADPLLHDGSYARKQIHCENRLISWSHRSRFNLACRLVAPYTGKKLLDYGSGDGTFLALVRDFFPDAVGVDVDPYHVWDCRDRFEATRLSFLMVDELDHERHHAAYEVVVCMEVLEHCTPPKREAVLAHLSRLVTVDATVIISVPIEIGCGLLIKQLARTLASMRHLGDYRHREKYTIGEFWTMMFAGQQTAINRPVYEGQFVNNQPNQYHGHKGFNWQELKEHVQERFKIEEIRYSPLHWFGRHLNSQVWLICRPRQPG